MTLRPPFYGRVQARRPTPRGFSPRAVLLWRMNSHRLEVEAVRDGAMATSGTLDPKRGGPEIPESEGQSVLRPRRLSPSARSRAPGSRPLPPARRPPQPFRDETLVV